MDDPITLAPQALSLVSATRVPNVFPIVPTTYRLAIVGEAPGADEVGYGVPFVGVSGKLLDSILSSVGALRASCFIGNICKYQPPGNDIKQFGFSHEKVQQGWVELQEELKEFKPNCILALGNTPLHFFTGQSGIKKWRGSILQTPFGKVVPAIHPAAVLREYRDWPLLRFDAGRARKESESSDYTVPQIDLQLDLSAYEICNHLDNWPAGQLLSFDIEGGLDAFPCCSIAGFANRGFIIAWSRHSEDEQGRIAHSLSRCLYRIDIPKVLQNSLYDRFVLAYGYRMLIRNVTEDTMDKSWAIYSELAKGLGTIVSIWTRHPYYKYEINADNADDFYRYCIKDSCCTLEACLAMDQALEERERKHYQFNVALKNPLLYMELRGLAYDDTLAKHELAVCNAQMAETACRLSLRIAPVQWNKKDFDNDVRGKKGSISATRLKHVLYVQKRYPEQFKGRSALKKTSTDVEALLRLCEKNPDDPFLSDILLHRKLESTRETLEWLPDPKDGRIKCSYNQFSKGDDGSEEGGGATDTGRLRCSQSIIGRGEKQIGGNLQTVTKKLRKLYRADPGMWLFQCDLAGADGWTVAAHCLKHGDATMWDDYRAGLKPALIVALMFMGTATNKTSREDLLKLSRAYKQWEKEHEDEAWIYFGCKRVQHGSNYGMQGKTMSTQIMKDSYKLTGKPVYVSPSVCESLQRLYFVRYPGIYQWHNWAKREVMTGKNLISASGHERKFFGRRKEWDYKTRQNNACHDTWKEFLADEPQENTTYATNLALYNLWHDPENRVIKDSNMGEGPAHTQRNEVNSEGILQEAGGPIQTQGTQSGQDISQASRWKSSLWVQPLHQVHDALIGQFPKERTEWAVRQIRSYFQNTLTIANTQLIIPFEGAYGPSWGELGSEYGGGEI